MFDKLIGNSYPQQISLQPLFLQGFQYRTAKAPTDNVILDGYQILVSTGQMADQLPVQGFDIAGIGQGSIYAQLG